ncbi:DUF2249 domain-containing protein [Hydrogenimonas cancrithermarum]|uniref:DUF2249 domain-containing protein n=1 Tax=Hydrogenimonas cancrithermarum TaxID=2993563 RepID=A0ABN6WWT4_9BACT|nr:DUF2249 domain-containing protein [Hydrogenimonas cancrithermarum]BDY13660.1 hypothetical protein HCR_19720 [Hydrogenimonas cancrithermarum]
MHPMLELDVRGLNHPEPLERSVEMFKRMGPKDLFRLVIHRMPQPLLMIAQRHGIRYRVCQVSEAEWHIWFTRDENLDLTACCSGEKDV